jgi:hypothetical protein
MLLVSDCYLKSHCRHRRVRGITPPRHVIARVIHVCVDIAVRIRRGPRSSPLCSPSPPEYVVAVSVEAAFVRRHPRQHSSSLSPGLPSPSRGRHRVHCSPSWLIHRRLRSLFRTFHGLVVGSGRGEPAGGCSEILVVFTLLSLRVVVHVIRGVFCVARPPASSIRDITRLRRSPCRHRPRRRRPHQQLRSYQCPQCHLRWGLTLMEIHSTLLTWQKPGVGAMCVAVVVSS